MTQTIPMALLRRSIPIPFVVRMFCVVAVASVAGCGNEVVVKIPEDGLIDGNRDDSLTSPLGKTFGEPNETFNQAIIAVFDDSRVARLQGTVSHIGDLDVFRIGPLERGDRLIVDVNTTGSPLDAAVAVFDAQGRLVYNNDDRGGDPARFLDSIVDWIVRQGSEPFSLVVSHSPIAAEGTFTGSYWVDVRVSSGHSVPPPAGQVLLLDFEGGEVDSPSLGNITLTAFDAGAISSVYEGETQLMKEIIRQVFLENFEAFDVTIVTTDDPPPPADRGFSTLHVGGFNPVAFGFAGGVDLYNMDFCDDAIVFTETFRPTLFSQTPTTEEMARAIANVGSHEAGHLLGLNHTDDDRDLMDDQSPADALIEDQRFMEAPLSRDVMPIGTQDGVMLLMQIVGPRP